MTFETFIQIESEVVDIINRTLDAVRDKSFSDYVLLLSRAGYNVEIENTNLSPYVIQSNLEIFQDRTRTRFLVTYLNNYAALLQEHIFADNDYREMDLNIQMMIYSQVWESHMFLKTLKRIASILSGKPYDWRIQFEKPNKKGELKPYPKAKFISDDILAPLKSSFEPIAKLIETTYDSQLRNDFAHASYHISIEDNVIESQDSEQFLIKNTIDLFEWERRFIYTIMLSYHLSLNLNQRLNSFITDYPHQKEVLIKRPSFKIPGLVLNIYIKPQQVAQEVEFIFVKKDNALKSQEQQINHE